MDPPNDPSHRRGHSTPQSIPLQDLTRPPGRRHSRRTLSDRGRDLLGRSRVYEPLSERSPSPAHPGSGLRIITSHSSNLQAPPQYNANEASPLSALEVEDGAAFQQAMGFAGLSFQGETSERPGRPGRSDSTPSFVSHATSISMDDRDGHQTYPLDTLGIDGDTLTADHPYTSRPRAHSSTLKPAGQKHDRFSRTSVKFAAPPSPVSRDDGRRLGDDLYNVEAGLGGGDIRRSGSMKRLSPTDAGSTLRRAGTMVRAMSQRIVNVSNESAEAQVDRSIRRKSSVKHSRPQGPQRYPSDTSYDGTRDPADPVEKGPTVVQEELILAPRPPPTNPLKGNSLGIFPPDSKIRLKLCDLLVHPLTEPFIFVLILLQSVLLTVDSASNVYNEPRSRSWGGRNWIDYAILVLFVIYSVELVIRVIVSGLIINPREYSTINRNIGLKTAVTMKLQSLFALEQEDPKSSTTTAGPHQPSLFRSFTGSPSLHPDFAGNSRQQQRARLAYRAYLRHSFNRLDFLAVSAYWASFVLSIAGLENSKHIYVFRMLSCLRIIRLLALTSGTSVILRSLKKAAPMLVNVALLIGFFWLIFAIIGIQAFKSSLRRSCVWIDPLGQQPNYTNTIQNPSSKFCGGWLDVNGNENPWLLPDGRPGAHSHKGYLCPVNSKCVQGDNPYNGTVSFDNLFQSLELVFVVMSSNTFSDLMYYLTDSDYLVAALFFAAGIVILYFWLINLLIAVITSSFQVIREESKASAFTAEERDSMIVDDEDDASPNLRRISTIKGIMKRLDPIFVVIITFDTIVMSLRSADMGPARIKFIGTTETVVTLVLLFEIIVRFIVEWRTFFHSKRNSVDLILAIVTTIIQIPQIHNSGQPYAWLTIFQIARVYRVVLAIPVTRNLIVRNPLV